ncbi:coiled-coil domain-containing protein 69-A-like [Dendronephthya gigantea]|uniref:coiled-coil domain-containing protein 69-A-like n=1 Tax=Dendronephthya gigantea TaxID=151771 RepID=UPI00106D2CA7|nr:coiled-coil domain-containing protein 69-A-like [Dendronephthya gigantea]
MTTNVSQKNDHEREIFAREDNDIPHGNLEKISQLKVEVDALSQENGELFILLQNERRRSKELEDKLGSLPEKSLEQEMISCESNTETCENFLQNAVLTMKEKLDSKQNECEDLEDKLCVMNQELASQGEELARATLEFQHQINHLHELLAQERDLNTTLSEESDQTVRELETKIQQKEEMNTELKFIQEETSEQIQTIEQKCRFYQTKLFDAEKRLTSIAKEHEQLASKEANSIACQVSEKELHALDKREREKRENNTLYKFFPDLWDQGDFKMNGLRSATTYKIGIFYMIRDGFKKLGRESSE